MNGLQHSVIEKWHFSILVKNHVMRFFSYFELNPTAVLVRG